MILHLHRLQLEFARLKDCSQSVLILLGQKGQNLSIDTRHWWTSVVIHCSVYWTLKSRGQNWVSSMSSSPAVHEANPYSRWESHRGSAAIDREPHWRSLHLLFFLFCFSTTFLVSPFLSYFIPTSLFTFPFPFFSSFWISPLPPSSLHFTVSFLTPKCESLSIFRCSPLPSIPLPLSYLLFFSAVEGRVCKSAPRFISVV